MPLGTWYSVKPKDLEVLQLHALPRAHLPGRSSRLWGQGSMHPGGALPTVKQLLCVCVCVCSLTLCGRASAHISGNGHILTHLTRMHLHVLVPMQHTLWRDMDGSMLATGVPAAIAGFAATERTFPFDQVCAIEACAIETYALACMAWCWHWVVWRWCVHVVVAPPAHRSKQGRLCVWQMQAAHGPQECAWIPD